MIFRQFLLNCHAGFALKTQSFWPGRTWCVWEIRNINICRIVASWSTYRQLFGPPSFRYLLKLTDFVLISLLSKNGLETFVFEELKFSRFWLIFAFLVLSAIKMTTLYFSPNSTLFQVHSFIEVLKFGVLVARSAVAKGFHVLVLFCAPS